jgi:hypothetical protein
MGGLKLPHKRQLSFEIERENQHKLSFAIGFFSGTFEEKNLSQIP